MSPVDHAEKLAEALRALLLQHPTRKYIEEEIETGGLKSPRHIHSKSLSEVHAAYLALSVYEASKAEPGYLSTQDAKAYQEVRRSMMVTCNEGPDIKRVSAEAYAKGRAEALEEAAKSVREECGAGTRPCCCELAADRIDDIAKKEG